jgi:hypothetical protein
VAGAGAELNAEGIEAPRERRIVRLKDDPPGSLIEGFLDEDRHAADGNVIPVGVRTSASSRQNESYPGADVAMAMEFVPPDSRWRL